MVWTKIELKKKKKNLKTDLFRLSAFDEYETLESMIV